MIEVFERRLHLSASAEKVFAWHESPGALQKLIPPGDPVTILEHTGGIRDGARVVLGLGPWPYVMRWVAVHRNYIPNRSFEDVQVHGPFAHWVHTHTILAVGPAACTLIDHVEYELPFGALGRMVGAKAVRRKLESLFKYRHTQTAKWTA